MKGPESKSAQHKEIDKLLRQAARLDYRKEHQTLPPYIPVEKTPLEEAKDIIGLKQLKDEIKKYELAMERSTPEERERLGIEEAIDNLKSGQTMSQRITRAQHFNAELIDKLQQYDPEFMDPIIIALTKRPGRQEKAENTIKRRSINPGVEHYKPLWQR